MRLEAKIIIRKIALSDLMPCFKREEVLGFCQNCDQYERNYSCPGHPFDEWTYVTGYSHAVLILTEIPTEALTTRKEDLYSLDLSSRVLDQHRAKSPDGTVAPEVALAMYVYDAVKSQMTERLLLFEQQHSDTVGLPPGSCTSCEVCLKSVGVDCPNPENVRYSLESLGFKVSDIYERFFDRPLEWVSGKLPATFQTCSAILSRDELKEEIVEVFFEDILVALDL
jgi:predicted metal-binding protein